MKVHLSGVSIGNKEKKYVNEVINSGILSFGKYTKKFENSFINYTGRKYAIAVSSGTAGLFLLLKYFNLNNNQEVITTPFSFIASSNVIIHNNAHPVFVDINEKTLCLDERLLEHKIKKDYSYKNKKLINKKTKRELKGIVSVNIFGSMPDYSVINKICKKYNLFLIEDSCESLGSDYKGKKAGTFGDGSVFAFYANKQITTGEGGIVLINKKSIYEYIEAIKNQGRKKMDLWLQHSYLGYNFRIDEMSTALGYAQMERIEEILRKRNKVANYYNKYLSNIEEINIPKGNIFGKTGWFVYVITVKSKLRNKMMDYLLKNGIVVRPYFTPIHLQPYYKKTYAYKKNMFPITEKIANTTIAIPFHTDIKKKEQDYVIKHIERFIKNA